MQNILSATTVPPGESLTVGESLVDVSKAESDIASSYHQSESVKDARTPQSQSNITDSKKVYFAFLWRIHFYAGLFIAPFILVAALTGTFYAIVLTVFPWSNAALLHVTDTGNPLPLNRQIAIAQAAHPTWKLTKIQLNAGYQNTSWIVLQDTVHQEHAIFVDPYRGTILGDLPFKKNSIELLGWVDNLHRNLLLGDFGRLYSELAASWMWVIAMSGSTLWAYQFFTSRRIKSPCSAKKLSPKTLHTRCGVIVFLGMIFLSITGITWSHYAGDHVAEIRSAFGWVKPTVKIAPQKLTIGPIIQIMRN